METEGKDKDREGGGGMEREKPYGCMAEMELWAGTAPTGPARVLSGPPSTSTVCKRRGVGNGDSTAPADLERDRELPFRHWRNILLSTRSMRGPRMPAYCMLSCAFPPRAESPAPLASLTLAV